MPLSAASEQTKSLFPAGICGGNPVLVVAGESTDHNELTRGPTGPVDSQRLGSVHLSESSSVADCGMAGHGHRDTECEIVAVTRERVASCWNISTFRGRVEGCFIVTRGLPLYRYRPGCPYERERGSGIERGAQDIEIRGNRRWQEHAGAGNRYLSAYRRSPKTLVGNCSDDPITSIAWPAPTVCASRAFALEESAFHWPSISRGRS